ncbi:MAG: ABC transporter permease [Saprospiraceae bacterium]|nr:MAG: ABC transporter permease [Saprospiraceae bacterium]
MLLKIAWRNIWRSRMRSVVVIMSIIAGVWALCFILSFSNGITSTYIENAIRDQFSHIQLHHPKFSEDKDSKFYLTDVAATLEQIRQMPETEAATARILATGMISSTRAARGVQITGVEPGPEAAVTHLDQKVVEGSYFQPERHNEILISRRTAEKLKVKLRSRVVLTFQNMDSDITAAAFRVVGLFDTGNMMLDESMVYVKGEVLKTHLLTESVHPELTTIDSTRHDFAQEIAIFLKDAKAVKTVKMELIKSHPDVLVEDYWEISPDVELYESQIKSMNGIVIAIFMLALIFGIVNTMLMAVLERYKELGMLMAIGMNKARVFRMIVLETLMLGLVAAPLGLGLGWLTVFLLQDKGIDLSAFSKGLELFGMETVIFPVLDGALYLQLSVAVLITALLASIYPARKAVRLKPVEALHKI